MHKNKSNVTKLHKSRVKDAVPASVNIIDSSQAAFLLPNRITVKQESNNKSDKVMDNILKSDMAEDINKAMNNSIQVMHNTIHHLTESANTNVYFAEEVLRTCSTAIDQAIQENIVIGKDMFQCRDVSDCLNFQSKAVNESLNNITSLFLNISNVMQNFISKKIENSSNCVDKNIKCCASQSL